jgi:aarF domain-containing kinase
MRTAFSLGRYCFRFATPRIASFPRQQLGLSSFLQSRFQRSSTRYLRRNRVLCAGLTPAAFVLLSEEDNGDGKTPEGHMLEASRAEIQKRVPDDIHGLRRAWRSLCLLVDLYIFEPIATGFRFLHLLVIFVPVIVTVPMIWAGRRVKDHDNERSGTIWWYGFLVRSMERAGPAFIKVFDSE